MSDVLIGLLLATLVVWLFYRHRRAQAVAAASESKRRVTRTKSPFHAVSIHFAANACAEAKQLAGIRFLAREAPDLPLPRCDVSTCQCRFAHYEDRRSGKDRRSPFAAGRIRGGTGKFDVERRAAKDRRQGADLNGL